MYDVCVSARVHTPVHDHLQIAYMMKSFQDAGTPENQIPQHAWSCIQMILTAEVNQLFSFWKFTATVKATLFYALLFRATDL